MALDVLLERRHGRPVSARTVDLGAGGARITSERPLRVDEELRFDVALPADRPHCGGTARVVRQARHNQYALRFESVAPDSLEELRTFVEDAVRTPLL